jgi:large subunit ribosomal protein L25
MDTNLNAEVRSGETGKGAARKLRKAGLVPAVVYGAGDEATPVTVDPKAITDLFAATGNRNTVVNLKVDGKTFPCLVREVQRHPLRRNMVHVDFYKVPEKDTVLVVVPVRGVGQAKGMTLGGRLRLIRREIRVRCNYKHIPATIDFDVTPMEIGDMVKASELPMPEGCALEADHDFNVLTLYGKRTAIVHNPLEEEAAVEE